MAETCELWGSMHHDLNMQFVQSADLAELWPLLFFFFFSKQKSTTFTIYTIAEEIGSWFCKKKGESVIPGGGAGG